MKDRQLVSTQEASTQLRAQLSEQAKVLAQTQKFLRISQVGPYITDWVPECTPQCYSYCRHPCVQHGLPSVFTT